MAVVTGAQQGVGLAISKRFTLAGAKLVMADIDDRAEERAQDLGAVFIKTDVSEEIQVKS